MALGDVVTAAGVEAKDHRVLAQEDPQPPPMAYLAFQVDEDHPVGLVGLGIDRLGVTCQQSLIHRLKQRFEAFQGTGHGASSQVQAQQPPLVKQPLRRAVAEELVDQDLHQHRRPQQSLGNQLGRRRSGIGSRTVFTGTSPLITSPSDPAPIHQEIDLDLFGILGTARRERCPTLGANALVLGQLAEILDDWQVAVVPPSRAGPILLLAPLARRGGIPIIILAFEVIGAILGRRFFTLSTEELILELAVLTAKLFDLGFEVLSPMHGPSVHSLPISYLLPQLGIFTPQAGNFLAQLEDFATKLPHQFGQVSRLGGRKWDDKRVFHDRNACNLNPPSMRRPAGHTKTGWPKLYIPGKSACLIHSRSKYNN